MRNELEKRAFEKGVSFCAEPICHTSDKKLRIQTLQPLIKSGAIRFSKQHRALIDEMKFFPKGSHDDGLDALEMVAKLAQEGCGVGVLTL